MARIAILFAGAHAIYFSALTKSPMGALVRTYWWMGVYLLAVPGITVLILSGMTAGPSARVSVTCLTILFMINPIGPFFGEAGYQRIRFGAKYAPQGHSENIQSSYTSTTGISIGIGWASDVWFARIAKSSPNFPCKFSFSSRKVHKLSQHFSSQNSLGKNRGK